MQIISNLSKHGSSLKKLMSHACRFRFLLIIYLPIALQSAHCLSHIITVWAPDDNGNITVVVGGPGSLNLLLLRH